MRLLVATLAACFLLAGCSDGGGDDDGDAPMPSVSVSASSSVSGSPNPAVPPPREVDLTVSAVGAYPINPAFDPTTLQAPAGAVVHMTFRNQETVPGITHNWVIDGIPDASSGNIAPGQTSQWDFTAPLEPGEHEYYCSIGDHRQRGMEGTFTVTVA